MLKNGENAVQWYKMINPIEHTKTKEEANKYKVEPYVISADIYGAQNLVGQGGWTWYTGSSSWYYIAGIEYILGLRINNNILSIKPCIPKNWDKYSIQYKFRESIYNIKVNNISKSCTGIKRGLKNPSCWTFRNLPFWGPICSPIAAMCSILIGNYWRIRVNGNGIRQVLACLSAAGYS